MWWLWCGKNSPIFGRTRMTTFERMLVADKDSHEEPKNYYYRYHEDEKVIRSIIEARYPEAEISLINGGQPVYYYIISAE